MMAHQPVKIAKKPKHLKKDLIWLNDNQRKTILAQDEKIKILEAERAHFLDKLLELSREHEELAKDFINHESDEEHKKELADKDCTIKDLETRLAIETANRCLLSDLIVKIYDHR